MIRETISNFQISSQLTENTMQKVERINPTSPSASNPLILWVAASSVMLIILMFGAGSQHLTRYPNPYSLETQTEVTVELVESPMMLNLEVKPDLQNQIVEHRDENNLNQDTNQILDEAQFSVTDTEELGEGKDVGEGWIQVNAPSAAGPVWSLSATPEGEVYAVLDNAGIWKLPADGKSWEQLTPITGGGYSSLALIRKWKDTLYFTPGDKLLISTDEGKTWLPLDFPLSRGLNDHNFAFTDQALFIRVGSSIYHSDDEGESCEEIKIRDNDLISIRQIVAMNSTLFVSSNIRKVSGLYRLNDSVWQYLPLPIPIGRGDIKSIVVAANTLYVFVSSHSEVNEERNVKLSRLWKRTWWVFRSNDRGDTWTDITPKNAWSSIETPPKVTLTAANETVLALDMRYGSVARSTDKGDTWSYEKNTGITKKSYRNDAFDSIIHATAVNEMTFYVGGTSGIHRSIDGGKSWHRFNNGLESRVDGLFGLRTKNKQNIDFPLVLFAITEGEYGAGDLVQSRDGGESWNAVSLAVPITPDNKVTTQKEIIPRIVSIEESDGVLYAKGEAYDDSLRTLMYRISPDGSKLTPVEGLPEFNSKQLYDELNSLQKGLADSTIDFPPDKSYVEHLQKNCEGASVFMKEAAMRPGSELLQRGLQGVFAVNGDTFYLEYNYKLYRWKRGDKQWYDTGIEETADLNGKKRWRLHIVVSGEIVYVATRNGDIMQSVDGGKVWKNVTPQYIKNFDTSLYKPIRDMIFVDGKVYISTAKGVISSSEGKNWRVLTDKTGDTISMEFLAASDSTVYGVSMENRIHQLDIGKGTWKQVTPAVRASISSLHVDVNSIYLGTYNEGVLRFDLE